MDLSTLRNLGIVAHIDAGKTTVTERILHCSGVEHRVGQVDEGTAVMDWMAEERERGITITSAATRVPWRDVELNLIDTPGHVDFTVEVERCMRVLDGAVLVIDAVSGVQAQSETVWRQMRRHSIPSIAFVNKCDRVGTDFLAAVLSLRTRLDAPAIPIQYPLMGDGGEGPIEGVIDLLERRAFTFDEMGRAQECPVPEALDEEIEVLRMDLREALADEDEAIFNAVVNDEELEPGQLRAALRKRVLENTLVPVLCGAALRGIGVPPLLDAVVDYLPSPLDRPPVRGFDETGEEKPERLPDPASSFTSLAFKLHASPHGDLTFLRIYAGSVKSGQKLWNPRTKKMERAARILRVHADSGEALESAGPGDIVALTGLKWTSTGDTLCDRADPILLEPPRFPEPVIAMVVEPRSADDREKLRQALLRLAHEDPSFHVKEDEDTGQWLIEGMGELHLEVELHRLEKEFNVDARVGNPRVSYREAISTTGHGKSVVDRILGGKEVFGAVELELVPAQGSQSPGVEWADGVEVPMGFRPTIEETLQLEAQSGPRFGFPLVGALIRITGGQRHERHESEPAYAQAATQALRLAMQSAQAALQEPVMSFEVISPEAFASGIIADLASRRAEVEDVLSEGGERTVRGRVPLANMFGYSTVVRSLSQGRAGFSMTPAGFRAVPDEELSSRGLVWA